MVSRIFLIVIIALLSTSTIHFDLYAEENVTNVNNKNDLPQQDFNNKIAELEDITVKQHNRFIVIFILLIVGIGILIFQIFKKRKAYKLLYEKNELIESQRIKLSDLFNSLSKSEEHYLALREMISDGLVILDSEDKIVFLNEIGSEILGLKSDEVKGKLVFQFMDTISEDIYIRNLSLIREGYSKPYEIDVLINSNNIRLYVVPKAIFDSDSNYKGSFNVFHLAKKRENSVDESSVTDISQQLILQSNDAILIANKYGEILEWNSAAEKITGYSRQELLGVRYWHLQSFLMPEELKYPNYKDSIKLLFQQAIETGDTPEVNKLIDRKIINADNKIMILQENNFIIDVGGEKLYCSIFRDNTNKKKMEEALFASEKRFRELADTMPQPVFETDRYGNLTFLSSSGFELLGLTLDDFDKGILISNYFTDDSKEKLFSDIKNVLNNQSGRKSLEYTLINKNIEKMDILVYINPFYKNNRLEGFRGIAIDFTHKKKAELVLFELAERYRVVFDTSPNMIGITRLNDQSIIDVNDTLCQIRNISKEQVIGKNTYENGLFQTAEIREEFWRLLRTNGVVRNYKFEHKLENGVTNYLNTNSTKVKILDEEYIISIVSDITSERNFQNAVLDSEVKYRNIFDMSPELIAIMDSKGVVLDINNQIFSLTGYQSSEIVGKNIFDAPFITAETKELLLSNFKARMSGKLVSPYQIELNHINGDSKIVQILGAPIRNKFGEFDKNLIIITDITENIKQQEEIGRQKFMLESITNTTPMSLFLIDQPKDEMLWTNKEILELFNYPKIESMNIWDKEFSKFIHPDDIHHYEQIRLHFADLGFDKEIEIRLKDKSGTWKWVYLKFVPFKMDNSGKIIQILGIAYDISERKQLMESIIKSENSLRDLNITKDKFFSIISHDLMNPISTFLGMSEVLYVSYEELGQEDFKKFAKAINDSAKKLYQLLENLLQWSRIQTGKIECYIEQNNLYEIVDSITNLFEIQANNKNLIIVNEIPKDLWCNCDINMVYTIFRNLISNAIKFSEKNKKIVISTKLTEDEILISVRDFGTGISKNTLNNLFKIDKVMSMPGTENEAGTGIGLIICKEFIELHNGKIWVESNEGVGTTFFFSIPTTK